MTLGSLCLRRHVGLAQELRPTGVCLLLHPASCAPLTVVFFDFSRSIEQSIPQNPGSHEQNLESVLHRGERRGLESMV